MKKKTLFLGLMIASASFFALSSCGSKKNNDADSQKNTATDVETGTPDPVVEQKTVTFETNGGTAVSAVVGEDGKISKPADPTKEATAQYSYTFAGWFKDELFSESFDFDNDVVEESLTLYAKWDETVNKYNVEFVNLDGTSTTQKVEYGQSPTFPTNPTKDAESDDLYTISFTFDGWYDSNNVKYTSTSTIEGDVVLQPKFSIKNITLNKTIKSAYVDVTSLVNNNHLNDVIVNAYYDIASFYSYNAKSGNIQYNVYTYHIVNDDILVVSDYLVEDDLLKNVLGKRKISASFLYLPEVLEFSRNATLEFNGKSFKYTFDGTVLYYNLDGYLTRVNDAYDVVYDIVEEEKPNLKEIDIEKVATNYKLYYESNPSELYFASLEGKKWILSENTKTNSEAHFFLEQATLSIGDVYKNMSNIAGSKVSAVKQNNFYYLYFFDGNNVAFELQYDEFGYLRRVTKDTKEQEHTVIYIAPNGIPTTNKIELDQFTNALFNATYENPGHFKAHIVEGNKFADAEYYYVEGQLLLSGPKISEVVLEFIDYRNKANIIAELIHNGQTPVFDLNNLEYTLTGRLGVYDYTLTFDAYGQPVKLTRKSESSTLTAIITYEFGTFNKVNIIANGEKLEVYLPLDKPLTYVPTIPAEPQLDGTTLIYVFEGYYIDADYKTLYIQEKMPLEKGMTLFAKFRQERRNVVTWHISPIDENVVETTYILKDQIINFPIAAPAYDEYTFIGWYSDPEFKNLVKFPTEGILELFAKYEPYTYQDYVIYGEGKGDMYEQSIDSVTTNKEFVSVGCLQISGSISKKGDKTGFETNISSHTIIKFDVNDNALIGYGVFSKTNSILVGLFKNNTKIKVGDQLSDKIYYLKNGELAQCNSSMVAEDGVEYYSLYKEQQASSNNKLLLEALVEAGTYFIVQATDASLIHFAVTY